MLPIRRGIYRRGKYKAVCLPPAASLLDGLFLATSNCSSVAKLPPDSGPGRSMASAPKVVSFSTQASVVPVPVANGHFIFFSAFYTATYMAINVARRGGRLGLPLLHLGPPGPAFIAPASISREGKDTDDDSYDIRLKRTPLEKLLVF